MSNLESVIKSCQAQMEKLNIPCDLSLLTKITKSLGPSVHNKDSKLVSSSSKKEMDTVKEKFIAKKLGCKDAAEAEAALKSAIDSIGSSNRYKLRPVFYYLLVKALKKESVFG